MLGGQYLPAAEIPNLFLTVNDIPYRFLPSVEGESKSVAATQQEVVDLSKYLYLADPGSCDIDNVVHMPHIVKFLNELRKSEVGPLEQITKLQTLINTVKMLVALVSDDGAECKQPVH